MVMVLSSGAVASAELVKSVQASSASNGRQKGDLTLYFDGEGRVLHGSAHSADGTGN
jgi:hypothetical protein